MIRLTPQRILIMDKVIKALKITNNSELERCSAVQGRKQRRKSIVFYSLQSPRREVGKFEGMLV